jgi:amino acid transporter
MRSMQSALYYLTTLAVLAVLVVLCMGLYSLLGQRNSNLSQKLMRWRVGLQFVAILLIMGFVLFSR